MLDAVKLFELGERPGVSGVCVDERAFARRLTIGPTWLPLANAGSATLKLVGARQGSPVLGAA